MASKTTKHTSETKLETKTKVPLKPAFAAKVSVKSVANGETNGHTEAKKSRVVTPENAKKNAETAAKKKDEQTRYANALVIAAERDLTTVFEGPACG